MNARTPLTRPLYDRALLLHGPKRNEILTLDEVGQYGIDSFSDVDYLSIYGLKPAEWYARGIRLLGRTAVECTRGPIRRCCRSPRRSSSSSPATSIPASSATA